jgi:hypothetical protein
VDVLGVKGGDEAVQHPLACSLQVLVAISPL